MFKTTMAMMVMMLGLVTGPAWAEADRTVDSLTPEVLGTGESAYLRVETPALAAVVAGRHIRTVDLDLHLDLPLGTTVELWSQAGRGLPWESEGGRLVDSWTLDERTGDLVRFTLPPALQSEGTLWIRLDPADEGLTLKTETIRRTERVTHTARERRRSP